MRCVYVATRVDSAMDRKRDWDIPLNPLPAECKECGFPKLDSLPKRYYLVRSKAASFDEIAMAACGNILVRERAQSILKVAVPGMFRFRATYYEGTEEKSPWVLGVPVHKLETFGVKKPDNPCPKCGRPDRINEVHDSREWFHLSKDDPSYGRKDKTTTLRKINCITPLYRFEACRETEYDVFKSELWNGMKSHFQDGYDYDDWRDVDRHLFFSVRLCELLKRAGVKGPLRMEYRDGAISPIEEELEWVEKQLKVLEKKNIPTLPEGTASPEDEQWLKRFLRQHAKKKVAAPDFAAFEKKEKVKLPKDFKALMKKVGPKSFPDIDDQEGYTAKLLPLDKLDCETYRLGNTEVKGKESTEVDGVMFATTGHGDCFCFDVKPKRSEHPVVMYNHDYRRFERFAPSFASCIRRFVGD